MSASCLRSGNAARAASALSLLAALLITGCAGVGKRADLPPAEEEIVRAKGDDRLLAVLREGGSDPFAAIAVFRGDAFLGQSAMLEQSSIPLLDEFGRAAILLLRPGQVVPLLKDPSVRRIAWLGPQERLARLSPSLELTLLAQHSAGTEGKEGAFLVRFRDVPGGKEEQQAIAAGFRIVQRGGPNLVLFGPFSRLPRLLEIDRIIYIEKASNS